MKKISFYFIFSLLFQECTNTDLSDYKYKLNKACSSKSDGLVDLTNTDFDYIVHANTLYISQYHKKIPDTIIDKVNSTRKKLTPFDGDISALFFFKKNDLIGTILYNELNCAIKIDINKIQTNYFKKNEHLYFMKIP